ncbi:hypothetical protein [Agathobacter rectalis]|uniref:hypothetical protein n=1 Tax=Agathobacter rectalis TaxID=39491 RepID=UPI003EDAEA17
MIIKIVTISLMAVFYICYFAKLISQKKQGIKTDQLGKGKEGFVKFIEVALKIITYLLPVIQIISIVFYSGANYAQTECQFRYCGTAIPFLTVRSTAR